MILLAILLAADTLVLPPVPLADDSGRAPDRAIVDKATSALESAAKGVNARMRAQPSRPTPPASTIPEALKKLEVEARRAAEELDTAKAVPAYRQLIGELHKGLGDNGAVDALFEARLALAGLYLVTKEQALAKTELDGAARLRPNVELDLARWPPNVAEAFAAAQQRVKAEAGADLDVVVDPAGAEVFVDGRRIAEAPTTIPLRRGPHFLWIGAAGHSPSARAVTLDPGTRTKVEVHLDVEPAFSLLQQLQRELAGAGRTQEALTLARALAKEERVANIIATAVLPVDGGYAMMLASTDEPRRLVVATLGPAFDGATEAAQKAFQLLPRPPGAFAKAHAFAAAGAPDPAALNIDDDRFFGVRGRRVEIVRTTPPSPTSTPVSAPPPTPAAEDSGSIWPWVGIGAGTLVVVGAAVVGAIVLFPLPPDTIQDPDRTTLSVGVAP